ncbi:winged helix-turn-helix domain-containing protein [Asticcacaulis excentricus]|uniref:ArsR family transcriptional regulator n=1 Tax=Asticcacaulis excentricus (strain ATCC 15261 / DSM 4724 / KCTC 12464 / NCIMB 9791 / VKM B-1370 / CB 48) TaxID=573065 RepID=E8RKQ1_ASTEC|nr:transcriptional regulator [Asticcacaulis excentricus]ADU13585.1 ArsR family transcriptional regulator [Asticcacaulis excentricus CB 48]
MPDEFNIERIDDVIHGRLRLGIMAYLSTAGSADFTTLKAKTQSTDGNLSVQVRKLEEANYVTVDKAFVGKKPVTTITLTEAGRAAFVDYLDAMRRLIDEAG